MYAISNNYKNYINNTANTGRSSKSKVVIGETICLCDKLKTTPKISHQATTFIGGFPSKTCDFEVYNIDGTLNLNGVEVSVYRGLDISGTIEYVPMGIFKAKTDSDIVNNESSKTITFKGYDRAILFDTVYSTSLDWTSSHTGLEIIQEVCTNVGVTLETTTFKFASYTFTEKPNFASNITYREVVSRIAEIGGEIAYISRTGGLVIKGQTTTNVTIPLSKRATLKKEPQYGAITHVALGFSGYNDDIIYPNTTPSSTDTVYKINDNPYVSLIRQDIIQTVATNIIGMSLIPYELDNFVDDFYLDLNDILIITDNSGTTFNGVLLEYDTSSRIKSNIKAKVSEETATNYEIAGSVVQSLNEVKLEVNHNTNEITTLITTTETLENSIKYFNVDLSAYNITIPTTNANKPYVNKNYDVNFFAYYKGEPITPNVSISGSYTGITRTSTNTYIRFAVNTSTAITNTTNEYTITFSYVDNGTTYTEVKKVIIALAVAGTSGTSGETLYTWLKYADTPTSGMSDDPTNKAYIGIAYNKNTPIESTTYSDYAWSLVKGNDGQDGEDGSDGVSISSLVSYFAVNSSTSTPPTSGWGTTMPTRLAGQYLWRKDLITYSNTTTQETTPIIVTGDKGDQGIQGVAGTSSYFYVRYSANSNGNPMTTTPQSNTQYTGVASTTSATAPTSYTSYTWSKTKGDQGIQGIQGEAGANGSDGKGISSIVNYYLASTLSSGVTTSTSGWTTSIQTMTTTNKYLWNYEKITYTDNTNTTTTPTIIGVYGNTGANGKGISSIVEYYALSTTTTTPADSAFSTTVPIMTVTNKYLWNYEKITYTDSTISNGNKKIIGVYGNTGQTGTAGAAGANGQTSYLHIKYSNDGVTFTGNSGEDIGSWIGTYVDFVELDSSTFSDYEWKNFSGDATDEIEAAKREMEVLITETSENIKSEVSESYVTNENFTTEIAQTKTELQQTAEDYTLSFYENNIKQDIDNLTSDVREEINTRSAIIRATSENNLPVVELGSTESPVKTKYKNDGMYIENNGATTAYFKDGKAYNYDMEVINSLALGSFAFVPRTNGNLSIVKIGGDS